MISTLCTQSLYCISIDPIQIQSSRGSLLYAEINFKQADSETPIHIGLAQAEDLQTMGIQHYPPHHLNFFIRKKIDGTGVITITSSQPITNTDLDIVIKIQDGDNIRLQHIQASLPNQVQPSHVLITQSQHDLSNIDRVLLPITIINEQDIALNHIKSVIHTQTMAENALTMGQPLVISKNIPPLLNVLSTQSAPIITTESDQRKIIARGNSLPTTEKTQKLLSAHLTIEHPINFKQQNTVRPSVLSKTENLNITKIIHPTSKDIPLIALIYEPPPLNNVSLQEKLSILESINNTKQHTIVQNKIHPITSQQEKLNLSTTEPSEIRSLQNNLAQFQHSQLKETEAISQIIKTSENIVRNPQKILNKTNALEKTQYLVQKNESLWKIASRIAKREDFSIFKVMSRIKLNNPNAFIRNDINKLKNGTLLNLDLQQNVSFHTNKSLLTQKNIKINHKPLTPYLALFTYPNFNYLQNTKNQNKRSINLSPKVMTTHVQPMSIFKDKLYIELALTQK